MSNPTAEQHNHCWHHTGVWAPATAPRGWAEFKCCHCGEVKRAENHVLPLGTHGPHAASGIAAEGGWQIW